MTGVILTVGNSLMGDDGAGPLLAELLEGDPAPGWEVIDGGSTPENVMHAVRARNPGRVLVVDAADMGLPPGTIRRIGETDVANQFLITTHAIPLNLLIASLRETVPDIAFLGIQPARVAFYEEMTPQVKAAVVDLHGQLTKGTDPMYWPQVS